MEAAERILTLRTRATRARRTHDGVYLSPTAREAGHARPECGPPGRPGRKSYGSGGAGAAPRPRPPRAPTSLTNRWCRCMTLPSAPG